MRSAAPKDDAPETPAGIRKKDNSLDVERLARALAVTPQWRRETDRYGGGVSRKLGLVEVAAAIAAAYDAERQGESDAS